MYESVHWDNPTLTLILIEAPCIFFYIDQQKAKQMGPGSALPAGVGIGPYKRGLCDSQTPDLHFINAFHITSCKDSSSSIQGTRFSRRAKSFLFRPTAPHPAGPAQQPSGPTSSPFSSRRARGRSGGGGPGTPFRPQ